MRNTARLAALLLTLAAATTAWAAPNDAPLADRLPAGSIFYAGWAGANQTFTKSAWGQMTYGPAVDRFLSKYQDLMNSLVNGPQGNPMFAVAMNSALDMAMHVRASRIAVALMDVPDLANSDKHKLRLAVLVNLGANAAKFRASLKSLLDTFGLFLPAAALGSAGGQDFQQYNAGTDYEFCYGFRGSELFLAVGPGAIQRLLAVTRGTSLQTDPKFVAAMKPVAGPHTQMALYGDTQPTMRMLVAEAGRPLASDATLEQEMRQTGATLALEALASLGLDRARSIAGTWRVVDGQIHSKVRIESPAPHKGVLAAGKALTVDDLTGIPDNALYASVGTADLAGSLKRITAIALKHDAAEKPLEPKDRKQREQIIGFLGQMDKALGKRVVSAVCPTVDGGMGLMVALDIQDRKTFDAAVAEAIKAAGDEIKEMKVKTTRVADVEIHSAVLPWDSSNVNFEGEPAMAKMVQADLQAQLIPCWAITNDRVLFATHPVLIRRLLTARKPPSLANNAAFRKGFLRLEGAPTALVYSDGMAIGMNYYRWLRRVLGKSNAMNVPGPAGALLSQMFSEMDRLIEAQAKLATQPTVCATTADRRGLTFEAFGSLPASGLEMAPMKLPEAIAAFLPAGYQLERFGKMSTTATNAKSVAMGLAQYRQESGVYPKHLGVLVNEGTVEIETMGSPLAKAGQPGIENGHVTDGHWVYIYPGPRASRLPATCLLLHGKVENYPADSRIHAVYKDGRVAAVSREELKKDLARTRRELRRLYRKPLAKPAPGDDL